MRAFARRPRPERAGESRTRGEAHAFFLDEAGLVLEETEFVERPRARVRVRADRPEAALVLEGMERKDPVAEIGLGLRAENDPRAATGEKRTLLGRGVGCVDDGGPRVEKAQGVEDGDRSAALVTTDLLDLGELLGGVDVEAKIVAETRARTLDERGRLGGIDGAEGMDGDRPPRPGEGRGVVEKGLDVGGEKPLLRPRDGPIVAPALVERGDEDKADPHPSGRPRERVRGLRREPACGVAMEIVELADRGVAPGAEGLVRHGRDGLEILGTEGFRGPVHEAAPRPEGARLQGALAQACEKPLEGVAVRVDHGRKGAPAVPRRQSGLDGYNPSRPVEDERRVRHEPLRGEDVPERETPSLPAPGDSVHDLLVVNARIHPLADGLAPAPTGTLAVDRGRVSALGVSPRSPAQRTLDARGALLLPGFVDCHTHALFAGDRAEDYFARLHGDDYARRHRSGGGLFTTVRAVRAADDETLLRLSAARLAALAREGVTTVEVKSGYGLSVHEELRLLELVPALGARSGVRAVPTCLAAHAVPPETTREAWLEAIAKEILPEAAHRGLARLVDIYVEPFAFSVADMERLFRTARDLGFGLRAHCEQFHALGASTRAAALGALSCDHLEEAGEEDVRALAASGTVAVLLPVSAYFLGQTARPPIEALRAHGVPMAVATDLNPGTSYTTSLLLALHLAVRLWGLTPEEAILGATVHAARALGLAGDVGSLVPGARADFALWDLDDPRAIVYPLGGHHRPTRVFVSGEER
jgi:imidazolonepropionase